MHGDGANLWLRVTKTGAAGWCFRYRSRSTGKDRETGLGSAATFSLTEARGKALEMRKLVAAGVDPLEDRDQKQATEGHTLESVAALYIDAHARAGVIRSTSRNGKPR